VGTARATLYPQFQFLRVTVNGRLIFRAGAAALRYFGETTLFRVRTSHHVQGSPAPPRGHAAGPIIWIEAQAREEIVPSCRAPVDDQAAKDYATMAVRATFELTGVTRFLT
jgi:hypothetical protein